MIALFHEFVIVWRGNCSDVYIRINLTILQMTIHIFFWYYQMSIVFNLYAVLSPRESLKQWLFYVTIEHKMLISDYAYYDWQVRGNHTKTSNSAWDCFPGSIILNYWTNFIFTDCQVYAPHNLKPISSKHFDGFQEAQCILVPHTFWIAAHLVFAIKPENSLFNFTTVSYRYRLLIGLLRV